MILVFGGCGFIGQHVARHLIDLGERVVVTASSSAAAPAYLAEDVGAGRAVAEMVEVTDPYAVMGVVLRHKPQIIIDLTGRAPNALSAGRDVAFRTGALLNILEAARINEVPRVVLMSSMDAYWGLGGKKTPFREDDPVPLLEQDDHFIVQAWAKKALEVIGNLYRRQQGMDVRFIRASGVYGPLYRTFLNVPSRLLRAAVKGIADFGADKGGIPFREDGYDQVYVKDMAQGIAKVALASTLAHPVYNIGSGGVPRYGHFADAVARAVPGFAMTLRSREDPEAAGAARGPLEGLWMDISRARDELGYAPQFTVEAAVADYGAWLRNHDY